MIEPTVGRVVWFYSTADESAQPHAATVAYVHSDRVVNLSVVDHVGRQYPRVSVALVQEGDRPATGPHATWMPYQMGQAAKVESNKNSTGGKALAKSK